MTRLKLLTALTALALLTACGGSSPTTPANNGDGEGSTTDCTANAFHADCLADTSALALRITDCITAGNAGDAKCNTIVSDATMNTAINTCLANPFDDTCTASDFTFSTYAEMARTNRVSFCESDSTDSSLCTALTTCQDDPFGATCGAYFESAKNPYCGNNPTSTSCVNSAVWLASFTGNEALPTTPNTTRRNQFLEISATTTATTLFMTGSTTNGVAFFIESGSYYAGILAGTNLGAPITETITSARWTGQIRAVSDIDNAILRADMITNFGVDITFDATRETKGTIKETFAADSQFVYEIDGVFDENGIITGRVDYGAGTANDGINPTQFRVFYSPGTLRGIIGQDGAVGVFHSNNDNTGRDQVSFSGGFFAGPPIANYATWLANARNSDNSAALTIPTVALAMDTPNPYGFITAGATELNLTDATQKNAVNLGELSGSNNSTSGFAIGQIGIETSIRRHIGILDGTNVGAPLPLEASITAEWTGLLAIETEQFSKKPIILNVGFDGGAGTIKTQTGGFEYHTTTGDAAPNIAIDGKFGTNGVIYGTTIGTNINSFAPVTITGTLTGLIGVNGAVAVFAGNAGNGGYGYVGGFVVAPPAN